MPVKEALLDIQDELNTIYSDYAKRDFDLKYSHYQSIRNKLVERDGMVGEQRSKGEFLNYYDQVFLNYGMSKEILPLDTDNNPDTRWIKSLNAKYEENYSIYVEIHVNENQYMKNDVIFKRLNLETGKCENSVIEWKNKVDAPIFDYFESNSIDTIMFDMLYEIYVDSVFYYFLECSSDE